MVALFAHISASLRSRLAREEGATAVEYGLIVGLIAVAIIAGVVLLGDQLAALFGNITDELADPSGVSE